MASSGSHRYQFLDALRGVAALCVGTLHATQIFQLPGQPPHASLAVDFFFCLSGFVIAFAYDKKFSAEMRVSDFMIRRVVRLYPLVLISVVFGGAILIIRSYIEPDFSTNQAIILTISGLLLIPGGLAFGLQAYAVNNPIWSIFFEIFINFIYAKYLKSIGNKFLFVMLMPLALALAVAISIANGLDSIGFENLRNFLFGFLRVGYPFLAGVLIFRLRLDSVAKGRIHWSIPICLIAATLLNYSFPRNVIYDIFCFIFIIPLIVFLGASTSVASEKMNNIFGWLGAVSYPFYLLHMPILKVLKHAAFKLNLLNGNDALISMCALLSSVYISNLVLKFFDIPIRNWLQVNIFGFNDDRTNNLAAKSLSK